MTKLKLVESTASVLRQTSQPVLENELEEIEKISCEMAEIMLQSNGIGLAAPQVGISKSFFIYGTKDNIKTIINPEILTASGPSVAMVEGCLSLPGEHYEVTRPDTVMFKYYDLEWQQHVEEASGFFGRVIQHETDHLQGICIDKIGTKKDIKI